MGRDRSYSTNNPAPESRRLQKAKKPADFLKQVFDVLLIVLIAGCPFLFAGRHGVGQFGYTLVAGLLCLTWVIRQQTVHREKWIFTGLEFFALIGVAICVVQLVPMPVEILQKISPGQAELMQVFNHNKVAGDLPNYRWQTFSLDPWESAMNAGTVVMFMLAGIVIRQRIRSSEEMMQVAGYCGIAGILVTGFALAQYYLGNGKFFWFYEHFQTNTLSEVKGPFTNANHFAGYICVLLIPVYLMGFYYLWENEAKSNAWSRKKGNGLLDDQKFLYSVGCFSLFVMMVIAAIMSGSRGALVLLAGQSVFLFLVMSAKRLLNGKIFLVFICLGFIAASGLYLTADKIFEANTQELLASSDTQKLDPNAGRRTIWEANLRIISQYPWTGTGLGSHYDVHTAYMDMYSPGIRFSHAENSYLNVASEAGIVALVLMIIMFLVPLYWNVQVLYDSVDRKEILLASGLLMGQMVLITHAVYDFNFYVPAIVMNFVLIIVLSHQLYRGYRQAGGREKVMQHVSSRSSSRHETEIPLPAVSFLGRITGTMQLGMLGIIVLLVSYVQLPFAMSAYDWERYLKLSSIKLEDREENTELLAMRIRHLQQVIRSNPHHALAHTELGQLYVMVARYRMEKQGMMPIEQLKDTIINGGFSDLKQIHSWLEKPKILGDNIALIKKARDHAQYAIELNPIQHQAMLLLVETGFIEGKSVNYDEALVRQSLKIAPYHADAQMAAGNFYWSINQLEEANRHYKIAFHRNGNLSMKIIQAVTGSVSVEDFIRVFEPDTTRLGYMQHHFLTTNNKESLVKVSRLLGLAYEKDAEKLAGSSQLNTYRLAAESYHHAGLDEDAERVYDLAIKLSPDEKLLVSSYGIFLYDKGKYEQALPKLEWACQHDPDNKHIRTLLDHCLKQQISSGSNSTFRY